jgi:outer membrane usher protein
MAMRTGTFRRERALLVIVAIGSLALLGASPATSVDEAVQRTIVEVSLNGVDRGQVLVALPQGNVLMLPSDLGTMGISTVGATFETVADTKFVSLTSLHAQVRYTLSEADLSLALFVGPTLLPHGAFSVYDASSPTARDHAPGAVFDYSIIGSSGEPVAATLLSRISLHEDRSLSNTFGHTTDGRFVRGLSTYLWEDHVGLRQFSAGDVQMADGELGGGAILGGVGVSRAFELAPDAIEYPLPSLNTVLLAPTTVQIYVGGSLVKTIDLPPGTYNINDIPVRQGLVGAQIVLRDPLGGSQTFNYTLEGHTTLLRKGGTDFAYAAGFVRNDPTGPDDSYGPFEALGRYRLGLSDSTTAGVRFEESPQVIDGGGSLTTELFSGDVNLALAASDARGVPGGAATFSFSTRSISSGASVTAQAESGNYANISQPVAQDRALAAIQVQASRLFSFGAVSLNAAFSHYRDSGEARSLRVGITRAIGPFNVSATIGRISSSANAMGSQTDLEVFVTRALSSTTLLSASTERSSTVGAVSAVTLQKVNLTPVGLSYNVQAQTGLAFPLTGSLTLGLPFARATFGLAGNPDGPPLRNFDFRGSVALVDRSFFFSQPVQGSYVTIEAPNLPGARVYLENQFAGWTDKAGRAFIPFLQPNAPNHVSISDLDVPPDSALDFSEQTIVPSLNGGAIVHFAVRTVHAVVGMLRVLENGRTRTPSYGDVTLQVGALSVVSDLDENGHFYFETLATGRYPATIVDAEGTCQTHISVPAFEGVRQDIGTVVCDAASSR